MKTFTTWSIITILLVATAFTFYAHKTARFYAPNPSTPTSTEDGLEASSTPLMAPPARAYAGTVWAWVTGYNTVPEQTDSTPCIAANGENICGLTNVVACPRSIPFETLVEIDGEIYRCVDRLALKYDNRFDISCDKDFACPEEVHGYKEVKILS